MSSMPDALSSASLLLAAIALVYGAWSPSIDVEVARVYSANAETKAYEQADTRRILAGRARPLTVCCWLVAIVFLPRCWSIAAETVRCVAALGRGCVYDDVAAVFVLAEVVVSVLAFHLTSRMRLLAEQVTS